MSSRLNGSTRAVPAIAASIATGASGSILTVSQDRTRGYDVYLRWLGNSIDPIGNRNYATFRLLVDGVPFDPFDAMTGQVGSLSTPLQLDPPVKLGQGCEVKMTGEVAAGAPSTPTSMGATIGLQLVPVGQPLYAA